MQIPEAHHKIADAAAKLGGGSLMEHALAEHIHPLFSRVLARNEMTGEIYLANHSLGRPLDMVSDVVQGALDAWYDQLDGAWEGWLDARDRYRAEIARLLRWPDERAIVPKTSAAQGLRAVLNAMPQDFPSVLTTTCEFDSIDFVLDVYHDRERALVQRVSPDKNGMLRPKAIIEALNNNTDLLVMSVICFATGQEVESINEIVEAAHALGIVVVLDAYHAFGVLPIDFGALDADFIIAGNYKYTRGGPGACFLAIHERHLARAGEAKPFERISPIDTGWFAKRNPFSYERPSAFADGGDAWLESTPPVLTYYQALPGLMLTNAIGVERLREYSLRQQQFLAEALGAHAVTTTLLPHRGAYILIEQPMGDFVVRDLKEAGVNADARPMPGSEAWAIRLCPDLLNTRAELEEAARRIGQTLGTVIRRPEPGRG